MPDAVCETCKHVFWAWDLTYKGKGYVAECRRYPPTWIGGIGNRNNPQSDPGWMYPKVLGDNQACGEYSPNMANSSDESNKER